MPFWQREREREGGTVRDKKETDGQREIIIKSKNK